MGEPAPCSLYWRRPRPGTLGDSCREHHDDGEHTEETAKEEKSRRKWEEKEKAERRKAERKYAVKEESQRRIPAPGSKSKALVHKGGTTHARHGALHSQSRRTWKSRDGEMSHEVERGTKGTEGVDGS